MGAVLMMALTLVSQPDRHLVGAKVTQVIDVPREIVYENPYKVCYRRESGGGHVCVWKIMTA